MSLRRFGAKLPVKTCLQAASVLQSRTVSHRSNFEGVFGVYCWDHETGFGEDQHGKLVMVSPTDSKSHTTTEAQLWKTVTDPVLSLDHNLLRDELQMTVLAYDEDSLCVESSVAHSVKLPIYKGDMSDQDVFTPDTDPFISGGTTGDPCKSQGGGADAPQKACA